jgi:dCMP deaminase
MTAPRVRPTPDAYFMGIAIAVRERANCLGKRVGAVLVREGRVLSTGYNGTPEDTENCVEGGCLRCSRPGEYPSGTAYDLCICVHAEQNALMSSARFGIAAENSTLYTTTRPCFGCSKELLQAKIVKVYYVHDWLPDAKVQAEYQRLQARFPAGIHRLAFTDPHADWAQGGRVLPAPG